MSKVALDDILTLLQEKHGLSRAAAVQFVRTVSAVINDGLQQDRQLKIKGLGTFKLQMVKDRESVDVNTGERIVIEGREKITFTADTVMKEIVNRPFSSFETVVLNDGVDFGELEVTDAVSDEKQSDEDFTEIEPRNEAPTVEEPLAAEITPLEQPVLTSEQPEAEPEKIVNEQPEMIQEEELGGQSEKTEIVGEEQLEDLVEDLPEESALATDVKEKEVLTEDTYNQAETLQTAPVMASLKEETTANHPLGHEGNLENTSNLDDLGEVIDEVGGDGTETNDAPSDPEEPRVTTIKKWELTCWKTSAIFFFATTCLLGMLLLSPGLASDIYEKGSQIVNPLFHTEKYEEEPLLVIENDSSLVKQDTANVKRSAVSDSVSKKKTAPVASETKNTSSGTEATKAETVEAKKEPTVNNSQANAVAHADYDSDPRVRTGAYRIVGVDQTVTVMKGQTLASISKAYLGEGMECYMEAVNKGTTVKEGVKLKIPKLELKKKSKKQP